MSRVRGARSVAWTLLLLLTIATPLAAEPASPGAPPRVLNLVRVKLKPRSAIEYNALEAQIVRAYERAKAKVYWICLQAPHDSSDVLYLNLHASTEAAQQMEGHYRDAVKQHPELTTLQQRLTVLTASTVSLMTSRRDDIDRAAAGVDFATLRTIRVTFFEVQPGREGEFLKAIRTTSAKEGSWLVYEANDSSTYALLTLKRTPISRRDSPAIPRALRRARGLYTKAETHVYHVRPSMSHVSQAFVAANPQLWRPATTTH